MVGRAADQAVGGVGDRLHARIRRARSSRLRQRSQCRPYALAVLLEGEQLALLRIGLEIVEAGDGLRAVRGTPDGG